MCPVYSVSYLLMGTSVVCIGYWIFNFEAINYRAGAETELDMRFPEQVESTRQFFEELLPRRFDADKAAGLDLVVQMVLDGEEIWVLTIRDGKLAVEHPPEPRSDATCTIRMTRADYLKLANGELSGDQAFLTRRLEFEGDMGKATSLLALGIL